MLPVGDNTAAAIFDILNPSHGVEKSQRLTANSQQPTATPNTMAKAEYADMIKTVSGALTKINKKSQHAADQKMVLATHRTAPTESNICSRIFLRGLSAVTRNTPVTADELAIRARFTAVSRAVAVRAKNMSTYQTDYAAFKAQKDLPGGRKTFKSYLWLVCGEAYDESQG